MAKEWSDTILISDLTDEPALPEELHALQDRISGTRDDAQDAVLNFSGVTYLNSSNIAQLLRLRAALEERNRRLRLCAVNNEVWSIMLLTGLDKVFHFAPDPASAIASLQIAESEDQQR